MPQYYVEDDHEAIILKEIFLKVQEEIVRRGSQVDCMGITEFNETLVKHLLKKVTVYEDKLVFEFKSGITVEVEN